MEEPRTYEAGADAFPLVDAQVVVMDRWSSWRSVPSFLAGSVLDDVHSPLVQNLTYSEVTAVCKNRDL
jgi:hypothetical protein